MPHINMVTLGVDDLGRTTAFDEALAADAGLSPAPTSAPPIGNAIGG